MLQLFICQVIHRDKITSALLFFAKFLKDLTQTAKSLSVGCVFTRLGISELNTKSSYAMLLHSLWIFPKSMLIYPKPA